MNKDLAKIGDTVTPPAADIDLEYQKSQKQTDVSITWQWNHPDRMRIPMNIEINPKMHYRWVDVRNLTSRQYDGWVKVDGPEGSVLNGNLILMCIPKYIREQKRKEIDLLTMAQKNELGSLRTGENTEVRVQNLGRE